MKYSFLLALIAVATTEAATIEQQSAQRYTYEDIREQELKCRPTETENGNTTPPPTPGPAHSRDTTEDRRGQPKTDLAAPPGA